MSLPRLSLWLPVLSLFAPQHTDAVDVSWHPPQATVINDVNRLMNGTGVYGFIFDSSFTPDNEYGTYNWCNMPHVRKTEYEIPPEDYKLQYVEVIHRHHKRTPYASNTFPVESYSWDCKDEGLFYYGQPMPGHDSSHTYWAGFENPINPFKVSGFNGTCTFPQITKEGLDDSWQHGRDIYGVYHDLLHFLPDKLDLEKISFRVTTNVITSQVAGMLIGGMYNPQHPIPLIVEVRSHPFIPSPRKASPNPTNQAPATDSLEPTYPCPYSKSLFATIKSIPDTPWATHLAASRSLLAHLDSISGVPPSDTAWHESADHYFDNLAARLCHSKPLPCSLTNGANCITQPDADTIFRLGQFEYSYLYRDAPTSLEASAGSIGVFVAEVAQHIRDQIQGTDKERIYRHNVAHDGSLSRLLSVLQVQTMVWPGMGAEVVFEVYRREGGAVKSKEGKGEKEYFVRVLYGGQVLFSSSPALGRLDMIPVEKLLGYFDRLVGERAGRVKGLCEEDGK
ncbi:hypothetical protein AJ79_03048 [Helicocarpus griseus UAMH5409]|uniref:Acid phosphatase n=1 Tax=Helicocarpus griseus UAMH5409 TaxID=1447875 RepID=A0A2B7XZP1_9EURO|nr:hypothetical protein AJ79_03048 [Helicocarpus griseus UAMH5409]